MTYDFKSLPEMNTVGKISIITAVSCVVIFAVVFLLNVGQKEVQKAIAQSATTTLTVLNTPPDWIATSTFAIESIESSTSTPTNSGDVITWTGIATDSNSAPYFMIVCAEDVSPVAATATNISSLGTAPPSCAPGVVEWGVSASTTSGQQATVSTTTTESAPFSERERWYAWVCDDDPINARCNTATSTGNNATNSSPFHVNSRPVFSDFYNSGPADPGAQVVFYSTSTDPDIIGGEDEVQLIVCRDTDYNPATNQCGAGGTWATTTTPLPFASSSATSTLGSPLRDQDYGAYGYLVDEHGHEAIGALQGAIATITVNNVAPTVTGSLIEIENGGNITLIVEGGETPGFTLNFTTVDNNSCDAVGGGLGDEVVSYGVSLYPSGVGSTTCEIGIGPYNVNNCYTTAYTPWNLVCVASTTTCTGTDDPSMEWNCTFPLWFTADPTDNGPRSGENWIAGVFAIDDDGASTTGSESDDPTQLGSLQGIALGSDSGFIPYPSLEPGSDSGSTNATNSILATGNVGLDQNISGEDMCTTFWDTPGLECQPSATHTIPALLQEFASTTFTYGDGLAMSSTSVTELESNIPKSTSTSSPSSGITYWGISVPGTISLAGSYTGMNSYQAVTAETADW